MCSTKIEFAVQMSCEGCVAAVEKSLSNDPAIKDYSIDLKTGSVVVESSLPTLKVQQKLESSGKKVAIRGHAGTAAGVAILDTGHSNIQGVVRFVQVSPKSCIVDGTVDGLSPDSGHRLSIHECGDISQGCASVGAIFNPNNSTQPQYGDLGTVTSGEDGRAAFRLENNILQLSDVIGRSLVLSDGKETRIACGIIARSSGLFQNPKMICACDGVTIWNEKVPPKALL